MGQRLNLEIVKNGKTIANCYMHWSAYTLPTLDTARIVLEEITKLAPLITDPKLLAVKALQILSSRDFMTGDINYAGLKEDSLKMMQKEYPDEEFNKATDRNAGLIAVTDEDIENTRTYEEGTAWIDLDTATISFNVFSSISLHEEDFEDFGIQNIVHNPIVKIDIENMSLEDTKKFIKILTLYDAVIIAPDNFIFVSY